MAIQSSGASAHEHDRRQLRALAQRSESELVNARKVQDACNRKQSLAFSEGAGAGSLRQRGERDDKLVDKPSVKP
jgi:hypothetical protein